MHSDQFSTIVQLTGYLTGAVIVPAAAALWWFLLPLLLPSVAGDTVIFITELLQECELLTIAKAHTLVAEGSYTRR